MSVSYQGVMFASLDARMQRPATRLTDASDVVMFGFLDNGQYQGNVPTLSWVNSYLIR